MPIYSRRRLLELTGATAVAVLAGCTSSGSKPTDGAEAGAQSDSESEHHDEQHDAGDDHHEEGGDEDHHDHGDGTPEEPSENAAVGLATADQQHHFNPHVVWVEPGGTVTWRLESGSHDVVAYHSENDRPLRIPEGADPWSTELLSEEGATVSHTFETVGLYDYFCSPHESRGMVGTVIVGHPDPHAQPALEAPQNSLPEGARVELANLGDKVNEALGHTH